MNKMRIAVLSPAAWRTPPEKYGPWEQIASNTTEGLVDRGLDVTLFATGDSVTKGHLEYICERPYSENDDMDPKVWECLHISHLMERSDRFDIIHNHYDFLPLTYSRLISTPMVTTIHGFSSLKILPVYKRYNSTSHYVSISDSDRNPELEYIATVYNGIRTREFSFQPNPGEYLLFFGRIHHEKGTFESIRIAKEAGMQLIISGIIQDHAYFDSQVKPWLNDRDIIYVGNSGPVERNKLLGNAYALLHPVNFEEPFGLSVAESMFCGTPVIAFRRGSMPELMDNGKTGFMVQSVMEAVEKIGEIKNISRKYCHEWAKEKFTMEKMVSDYLKVYETVLGK
jgi:glycosyltransferase involved in cell wall biosynthesis